MSASNICVARDVFGVRGEQGFRTDKRPHLSVRHREGKRIMSAC